MVSYDPGKPLISLHVPKCAGTSFVEVLQFWFKEDLYLNYHDEKNNLEPEKYDLFFHDNVREKKICLHGHFNNARGNSALLYYPQVDQFITILRHPFDVHLSTYFYVRREAESQGAGAYRNGKPRKESIPKGALTEFISNNILEMSIYNYAKNKLLLSLS